MTALGCNSGMVRDSASKILLAFVGNLGKASNNVADAMALLWGLKLVISVGRKNVEIEGDLKVILDTMKCLTKVGWDFRRVIEEVWHMLTLFQWYDLQHIYQEGNGVDDMMVVMGLKIHDLRCWRDVEVLPNLVISLMTKGNPSCLDLCGVE